MAQLTKSRRSSARNLNGRSRPSAYSMISAARKCHASIRPAAFPRITVFERHANLR